MSPTTKRTTHRVLLRALLLLAPLMALAGVGQSQTASPCLSSQLSARHEADDAAMAGHRSIYFSLRNKSQSPCTLKGTAVVAMYNRAGSRMKSKQDKGGFDDMKPQVVTLAPGKKAFFGINYASCIAQSEATQHKTRCLVSAKLGFAPPGAKGMVMISEKIDTPYIDVSPIVATLKELGVEQPEKPKP